MTRNNIGNMSTDNRRYLAALSITEAVTWAKLARLRIPQGDAFTVGALARTAAHHAAKALRFAPEAARWPVGVP